MRRRLCAIRFSVVPMGGQVLGGGVIVLVAVLLWLVYLLPSWHGRYQYNAAERNAVRLNQALRILAETSETPEEVRVELSARTALAQQKLARRAQAERESADLESAREELLAAKALPAARRSRSRRRARLLVTIIGLIAVGVAVWGGFEVVLTGSQMLLWSAVAGAGVCAVLLGRMSRVQARRVVRTEATSVQVEVPEIQDLVVVPEERTGWTPRELPKPLSASAGSRAAAVLNTAAAHEALRAAAVEEAMRERAELRKPPSIDTARTAARAASVPAVSGGADDAEIEAHVRELLRARAAS